MSILRTNRIESGEQDYDNDDIIFEGSLLKDEYAQLLSCINAFINQSKFIFYEDGVYSINPKFILLLQKEEQLQDSKKFMRFIRIVRLLSEFATLMNT